MNRPPVHRLHAVALAVCAVTCTGSWGCSSPAHTPPTGPHVADKPIVVPYPPPAARVEVLPPPSDPTAVWIDGEWQWKGRRWAWQRGQWQLPTADAYYAPSTVVRLADGTLVWFAGSWQFTKKK